MGEADDGAAFAESLRRELSLGEGLERFASGSVPVFAAGAHVIKLFPPEERPFWNTEWAALTRVEGRLPIPTPRPIAAGERGPWLYIVMSRLSGRPLDQMWEGIDGHSRRELMRAAGAGLAALHAIPTDAPAALAIDWPRFIDEQRASCRERQLAKGLAAPWADPIPDYLARWTPRDDGGRVLLHTEVMRQHLMVERREDAWHLSGMVDFEPAMLGAPEYEWAAAGVFLTCAEPGLLRALLDAYGGRVDDELPLRIMAYALLHRYSSLRWYLERLPVSGKAGDLEALAREWFAV